MKEFPLSSKIIITKHKPYLLRRQIQSNDDTVITSLDREGKIVGSENLPTGEKTFYYKNSAAMLGLNAGWSNNSKFGSQVVL